MTPGDGRPRWFHRWRTGFYGQTACLACHQWDHEARFWERCPNRVVGAAWGGGAPPDFPRYHRLVHRERGGASLASQVEACGRCGWFEFYIHRGELYCSICERKHAFSVALKAALRKQASVSSQSAGAEGAYRDPWRDAAPGPPERPGGD